MRKNTYVTLFVLLALCIGTAYAGNESKIGTAGAQELLMPTDARGAALGSSAISNTFGVSALYWNPAGAAVLDRTEAIFTHIPWIADIDIEYAAVATPIEDFGTIGLSLKVVSLGDMDETTVDFPEGTGRSFSPSYAVLGATFSKALTANINFGFSGHVIREDIFEVSATGYSIDFGFTYKPRWEGMSLGIVMKNFGPDLKFSGRGFERVYVEAGDRPVGSNNASFELPTSVNIGLSYNFYNKDKHSITTMGNFRANNHTTDYWQGGAEYSFDDWLFLRGGYGYSEQQDYIFGTTLGAGITRQLGGLLVTFDYTWWDTKVFDNNQFFTFKIGF